MSKILIVSPVECYPVKYGNSARITTILEYLIDRGHDVHFLHLPEREFSAEIMISTLGSKYYCLKSQDHSDVISRLRFRIIHSLLKFKWYRLIKIDDLISDDEVNFFKRIYTDVKPDTVLINYTKFSKLLEFVDPNVNKIIDTHDSLYLRFNQIHKKGAFWKKIRIELKDEINCLNRADSVVAIQDEEARFFIENGCQARVVKIGHLGKLSRFTVKDDEKYILYIGANYDVNLNSISWFLDNIWEELSAEYPEYVLIIAGSVSEPIRNNFGGCKSLIFINYVEDISSIYAKIRFAINPVLSGSGLKIKNIEALFNSRPIVTSHTGMQGMKEFLNKGLFLAEDIQEWKDAFSLLDDDKKYAKVIDDIIYYSEKYLNDNLSGIEKIL